MISRLGTQVLRKESLVVTRKILDTKILRNPDVETPPEFSIEKDNYVVFVVVSNVIKTVEDVMISGFNFPNLNRGHKL